MALEALGKARTENLRAWVSNKVKELIGYHENTVVTAAIACLGGSHNLYLRVFSYHNSYTYDIGTTIIIISIWYKYFLLVDLQFTAYSQTTFYSRSVISVSLVLQ